MNAEIIPSLRSPFVYQLQNQPTPTSMLCQSAYRENSIVPGPEVDVQGAY